MLPAPPALTQSQSESNCLPRKNKGFPEAAQHGTAQHTARQCSLSDHTCSEVRIGFTRSCENTEENGGKISYWLETWLIGESREEDGGVIDKAEDAAWERMFDSELTRTPLGACPIILATLGEKEG